MGPCSDCRFYAHKFISVPNEFSGSMARRIRSMVSLEHENYSPGLANVFSLALGLKRRTLNTRKLICNGYMQGNSGLIQDE